MDLLAVPSFRPKNVLLSITIPVLLYGFRFSIYPFIMIIAMPLKLKKKGELL